jgi:hypothetical protein
MTKCERERWGREKGKGTVESIDLETEGDVYEDCDNDASEDDEDLILTRQVRVLSLSLCSISLSHTQHSHHLHQVSKKGKGKGDPLVTTTRRKSLPLDDKVRKRTMGKGKGKGKGTVEKIDLETEGDVYEDCGNDESEDEEDLTHLCISLSHTQSKISIMCRRRKGDLSLPLNDKVRKGTMRKVKKN